MKNLIHKKIIAQNWPELLDYPINPDEKYKILRKNSILFYFATRANYILNKKAMH